MSIYEDGKLIGTEKTDVDLSVLEDSTQNWIGFGQFSNDILSGMVADFKIYNYAMTAEEVAAIYNISDEERVARDKAALDLGDLSEVTKDIMLPGTGDAGSSITWESSHPGIIDAATGAVTRPEAGKGDAEVTLTATISSGDVKETKTFTATVKQNLTAEEIVEKDKEALDLGNLSAVSENLILPTEGESGAVITWTSSDETVIAADGTVNRPVGQAAEVTLTATITYGNESTTKEFTAVVVPMYEKNDIVMVEEINVTTSVGVLPSLPAEITVVYEDNTDGKEKVVWPTNLSVNDFKEAGTKEVTGTIVDYDIQVTAYVTITEEAAPAPQKSASGFELSDITLDGDDTIFAQNKDLSLIHI